GAVINQQSEGVSGGDIAKMIASMVAEVINRQDIPDDVKNDYAIEAESLKRELQKSRVNPGRVREMLAFLGDAEGTLGLAGRVAPWFLALGPLVEQYLSR
ncbi:MAG: hypothetical protein NTZ05_07505, partial [Chloroflexi bacterium]|nr:hypothetical protein [Chloroflexota bacterium]